MFIPMPMPIPMHMPLSTNNPHCLRWKTVLWCGLTIMNKGLVILAKRCLKVVLCWLVMNTRLEWVLMRVVLGSVLWCERRPSRGVYWLWRCILVQIGILVKTVAHLIEQKGGKVLLKLRLLPILRILHLPWIHWLQRVGVDDIVSRQSFPFESRVTLFITRLKKLLKVEVSENGLAIFLHSNLLKYLIFINRRFTTQIFLKARIFALKRCRYSNMPPIFDLFFLNCWVLIRLVIIIASSTLWFFPLFINSG